MVRSKRAVSAFVLVGAVVVPGVVNYALVQSGFGTLGTVIWVLGYGVGVLALWYVWLRPLDLSGPEESDPRDAGDRATEPEASRPRSNEEARG